MNEVGNMAITVAGRNLKITDSLRAYAEEKIGAAMKVIDIEPLDAEVVLFVEKNPAIANRCACEVTIRTKGNIVRVEENEQDMNAAIDVAAAKVVRQLRKYKTKVIDRKVRQGAQSGGTIRTSNEGELDLDALMAELAAEDEVVRVKEHEFEPLTEEEALIEIDLLGHDFFAYIDRDTNAFCVLYRRAGGGYGLLKQKID
jgi:putative sigma-54 modulation protein